MKAYITILSTDNYYRGVLVLHRALKAVNSLYPLHCVLSANVSRRLESNLEKEGIPCVRLSDKVVLEDVNARDERYSNWNHSFDKLQIWGLTQYEKLVFLDSDMLILRNLDSLFEREAFSGVCAGKSYPGHENWRGINSGLVVIEPDVETCRELVALVPVVVREYRMKNLPVGDQDVLQRYLTHEWNSTPSLQLDEGYNMFADFLTYYIRHLGYGWTDGSGKPVYVVHFIGKLKPWMKTTLRNKAWLMKVMLRNPHYFLAYRKFRSYLKK